ncbi:MAG: TauD/TfdA family dioxygenase [Bryobacteraceae bacterium]|nr:TauD/TfdA family dioxygenase [Bryobacteraceae bacterium]
MKLLSGALGAEISGIDLAHPLTDAALKDIQDLFARHLVLVFPAQDLTPAQQVAFTRNFGPVEPHPLGSRRTAEGQPEVLIFENKPGTPGARNDFWHSDISYVTTPPGASVLHARVVTEGRGDTMFCNMYTAYEELSSGLRRLLESLSAVHSAELLVRRNNETRSDGRPIEGVPPAVEHPVIRSHPVTRRKAIYVNPYFTSHFSGMTGEESRPMLEYLHARATRPENVYRHHWRRGDVLMWDNRATMHYAVYDYDENMPRRMHRTTAGGERPS